MNADGGPPRLLPTIATGASSPSWSADGRWIYFVDDSFAAQAIWKVGAAGEPARKLANNGDAPQESPDGSRVLFSREMTDDTTLLWSASVDGGDERAVAGMPPISGAWLSTRNGIYFIDNTPIRPTLNLFDPASHAIRRIAHLGDEQSRGGDSASPPTATRWFMPTVTQPKRISCSWKAFSRCLTSGV